MKCFRIDEGGEFFYYAAETSDAAMECYREDISGEFEGGTIREVPEDEMIATKVTLEDETESPEELTTLKQLFGDETAGPGQCAIQLCGSVY